MNIKSIIKSQKILVIIGAIVLIAFAFSAFLMNKRSNDEILSFDDCVKAGNPVMETYPQQCNTQDGRVFVQEIGNEFDKQELIRLDTPRPNQKVTSPVQIKGTARADWFWEGELSIKFVDLQGNTLVSTHSNPVEDWLDHDFVDFEASVELEIPEDCNGGFLYIQKSNPSNATELDDALVVPINF